MRIAVVLGAGFSRAAELPLTRDLFSGPLPITTSLSDTQRMREVRGAYADWAASHPGQGAEQWLRELYDDRDDPLMAFTHGTEWFDVIQYLLRRLTKVAKHSRQAAYYHGITRPSAHPVHAEFWNRLLSSGAHVGVITLNYDILAEQALHRLTEGHSTPIFYYGGLPWGTHVRKMVNVAAPPGSKHIDVPLGHEVPIYKLHGSVTWAFEDHTFSIKVHDDVRAAYRGAKSGGAAIIPPIEEKQMTDDFGAVWAAARRELSAADRWIICGYSMPDYDKAVRALFERASGEGPSKRVSVIDPSSQSLVDKWNFPNLSEVVPLDGLPDGLQQLPGLGAC